jgi:hypothetical protein
MTALLTGAPGSARFLLSRLAWDGANHGFIYQSEDD